MLMNIIDVVPLVHQFYNSICLLLCSESGGTLLTTSSPRGGLGPPRVSISLSPLMITRPICTANIISLFSLCPPRSSRRVAGGDYPLSAASMSSSSPEALSGELEPLEELSLAEDESSEDDLLFSVLGREPLPLEETFAFLRKRRIRSSLDRALRALISSASSSLLSTI